MNPFRIIFRKRRVMRRIRRVRRKSASGRRDFMENKERARMLVHERVEYWRNIYNIPIRKIAIRNQITRWGSCSKNGNLNFNYRIIHLPANLADYLIVHELCHLIEFNHSKAFWGHVGRTISDYRKLRAELKKIKFK